MACVAQATGVRPSAESGCWIRSLRIFFPSCCRGGPRRLVVLALSAFALHQACPIDVFVRAATFLRRGRSVTALPMGDACP